MGSKKDMAACIKADTRLKIEEMNQAVSVHKKPVMLKILDLVYDIKLEMHNNYRIEV
ncbi:PREDICTED: V-type proton ATPase subunit G-like [Vollenhovia emeryi]|uniref:V-type proton ATPase subunit G-like n=1 Tax=Vollenhovia emeryi TaxID=411798 RepID=UPI0005F57394|nr:PREDICTED: V-type proton ATPase subunit G-like [Vollenhovia emeryi]